MQTEIPDTSFESLARTHAEILLDISDFVHGMNPHQPLTTTSEINEEYRSIIERLRDDSPLSETTRTALRQAWKQLNELPPYEHVTTAITDKTDIQIMKFDDGGWYKPYMLGDHWTHMLNMPPENCTVSASFSASSLHELIHFAAAIELHERLPLDARPFIIPYLDRQETLTELVVAGIESSLFTRVDETCLEDWCQEDPRPASRAQMCKLFHERGLEGYMSLTHRMGEMDELLRATNPTTEQKEAINGYLRHGLYKHMEDSASHDMAVSLSIYFQNGRDPDDEDALGWICDQLGLSDDMSGEGRCAFTLEVRDIILNHRATGKSTSEIVEAIENLAKVENLKFEEFSQPTPWMQKPFIAPLAPEARKAWVDAVTASQKQGRELG